MAIPEYLTAREAAQILGVNDSRVRQLYLQGRLRGEKKGPILMFARAEVEQFSTQERLPGRPKSE